MMPTDAATAEAVKNSMFPGAAVMYWLGTRDLHALAPRLPGARRRGFHAESVSRSRPVAMARSRCRSSRG